jgi:magnesium chelatase family protein
MMAMGVVLRDAVEDALVLGELALDGENQLVSGVLPAVIAAAAASCDLICPHDCGSEAAWSSGFASVNAKNGTSSTGYAGSC